MIKKENIRIAVTISKSMNEKLQQEADYQGRSVSNLVAQIIRYYFKHKKDISLE